MVHPYTVQPGQLGCSIIAPAMQTLPMVASDDVGELQTEGSAHSSIDVTTCIVVHEAEEDMLACGTDTQKAYQISDASHAWQCVGNSNSQAW